MKIYTKTGDKGETGFLGKGRLSKSDQRIEAYGTVDELNSTIGICILHVTEETKKLLITIQNQLFEVGSELASEKIGNRITEKDTKNLEDFIDHFDQALEPLKSFVLPGGSSGSAWLHLARTVTRRAERRIVVFSNSSSINDHLIPYINRLSDLFFILARYENHVNSTEDIKWVSNQ